MTVEVSKLRGRIVEKFGTIDKFADEAHCSRAFISKYLNNKTTLDQKTILKWAGLLAISVDDIPTYFFRLKVDDMEQMT